MPEFRVTDRVLKRERRFRIFAWSSVFLLVAAAGLLLFLHSSGYMDGRTDLRGLFILLILSAAISAVILGPQEGIRRAAREMVFVLDETGILRSRPGYPNVRIAFSEIQALTENSGWLVINSTKYQERIAVPKNVGGYELIRAELVKHHALSARSSFSSSSILLLTVSILSWSTVLLTHDSRVIISGGIVGLAVLAVASRHLLALPYHSKSNSPLLWISLGFGWFAAILLICFRVLRP